MTDTPYKSISTVAKELGIKTHTIRFWETKFPYLSPKKNGGTIRYYSAKDVDYLKQIKKHLKEKGYTIKGVVNLIKTIGIEDFRNIGSINNLPKKSSGVSLFNGKLPVNQTIALNIDNKLSNIENSKNTDNENLLVRNDIDNKGKIENKSDIDLTEFKNILNKLKILQNKIT